MRLLVAALAASLLIAGCSDGGGGGDGDGGGDGGDGSGASATGPTGSAGSPTGGSLGNGSAPPAPQTVTLEVAAVGAYPVNPAFDPSTATVPAGATVLVTFSNDDSVPVIAHNWVVDGIPDAGSDAIDPGEETQFSFVAPATGGTFAYYCSIGDHRDRGMEGTLTVA